MMSPTRSAIASSSRPPSYDAVCGRDRNFHFLVYRFRRQAHRCGGDLNQPSGLFGSIAKSTRSPESAKIELGAARAVVLTTVPPSVGHTATVGGSRSALILFA